MISTQILPTSNQHPYEADFIEWIGQAAELLKQGRFDELDLENLIEAVESLGRSEKNALISNLRVLLMHLLKWYYLPNKRSDSCMSRINEYCDRIQLSLDSSPSLKNDYLDVIEKRYVAAGRAAVLGTGLKISTFFEACPYSPDQILDDDFPIYRDTRIN